MLGEGWIGWPPAPPSVRVKVTPKPRPEGQKAPHIHVDPKDVVLTEEEKRNGWTEAALAEYIAQRTVAATIRVFGHVADRRKRVLKVLNSKRFHPHRWVKGGKR